MSATQTFLRAGGKLSALLAFFAVAAIAGTLIACVVTPGIAIAGTGASKQISMFQNLPSTLEITPLDQKSRLYAKDGKKQVLLASFFDQNRDVLKWEDVSSTVKNAAVAAEDVRFYQHGPIDPNGIARALITNARGGDDISGASTISQQYVKNVCIQQGQTLPTKAERDASYVACTAKSVNRKVREMRYAIGLEKKYSKDEILLGYLNIAGFGGRTYGVEAAAEYYFGKSANELSIGQAATLMSIVNNPEKFRLDRKANFAGAEGRRNYVLNQELTHGMITPADYQKYSTEKIETKLTPPSTGCDSAGTAGFFCAYVKNTILTGKQFGKTRAERLFNLNTKGWKIYTTLNLNLQKKAQKVMNTYVPMKSSAVDIGGAAVSVQVGTGRVVSMVQNKVYDESGAKYRKDFKYSAVNFNVNRTLGAGAGFQPGSTFKSITLIEWLKTGHTINQKVNGNARTTSMSNYTACGASLGNKPYPFKNDSGEKGTFTVREGTKRSINGVFLSMAQEIDLCNLRKQAESMGAVNALGGQLDLGPSMAIGTASSVAPIGMATVFGTIANKGTTCQAIGIDKIIDSDGKSVAVPKANCKRTVAENVAIAAGEDLHGVITGGTMATDQLGDGRFMIGKTGTTDFAKDTWAIGSTTKVTTAVWVGNRAGHVNLRNVYSFPYCPAQGSTQAAIQRHCVFKGIQGLMNKAYGGATSWPSTQSQFLNGGKAISHADARPVAAKAKSKPKASAKPSSGSDEADDDKEDGTPER